MKSVSISLALVAFAMIASAPADAQKIPRPINSAAAKQHIKAARLAQKMQLKQDLAGAKATVKRGKPFVKRQAQQVKQSSRAVVSTFKTRMGSKARLVAAKMAYDANPTPKNLAGWQSASADYRPKREAHKDAVEVQKQAQAGLDKVKGQQQAAVEKLIKAQFAMVRGPAKVGKPAYSQYGTLPLSPKPGGYGVYGPIAGSMFNGSSPPKRTNAYATAADNANLKAYENGGAPRSNYGLFPPERPSGYALAPAPAGAQPFANPADRGAAPPVPFRLRQNANQPEANAAQNQAQ